MDIHAFVQEIALSTTSTQRLEEKLCLFFYPNKKKSAITKMHTKAISAHSIKLVNACIKSIGTAPFDQARLVETLLHVLKFSFEALEKMEKWEFIEYMEVDRLLANLLFKLIEFVIKSKQIAPLYVHEWIEWSRVRLYKEIVDENSLHSLMKNISISHMNSCSFSLSTCKDDGIKYLVFCFQFNVIRMNSYEGKLKNVYDSVLCLGGLASTVKCIKADLIEKYIPALCRVLLRVIKDSFAEVDEAVLDKMANFLFSISNKSDLNFLADFFIILCMVCRKRNASFSCLSEVKQIVSAGMKQITDSAKLQSLYDLIQVDCLEIKEISVDEINTITEANQIFHVLKKLNSFEKSEDFYSIFDAMFKLMKRFESIDYSAFIEFCFNHIKKNADASLIIIEKLMENCKNYLPLIIK